MKLSSLFATIASFALGAGLCLVAAGFGEFQPIAPGDSDADYAKNRRIELKLIER